MRKITVSSFDDLQALQEGLHKADAALLNAVSRGSMAHAQAALKAGAFPLGNAGPEAKPLLLQALQAPQGEDLLCELLSNLPPLKKTHLLSAGQLLVQFEGISQVTIEASSEEDEVALARLEKFLGRSLVWTAAYTPKADELVPLARLRDTNAKLVEAAKSGYADQVETAMAEGASVLAADADGKPALVWAAEHVNHAQLLGAMLANDPTVSIYRHQHLRNQPHARMIKGGNAPFLDSDEAPAGPGHEIPLRPEHINATLQAHLKTRDDLANEMTQLQRVLAGRGVSAELRWPGVVDFQRLLQDSDRFNANLWAVQTTSTDPDRPSPPVFVPHEDVEKDLRSIPGVSEGMDLPRQLDQ